MVFFLASLDALKNSIYSGENGGHYLTTLLGPEQIAKESVLQTFP
jgi:hypothetical protein